MGNSAGLAGLAMLVYLTTMCELKTGGRFLCLSAGTPSSGPTCTRLLRGTRGLMVAWMARIRLVRFPLRTVITVPWIQGECGD